MKALHSICPCAAGYLLYEQFRADVKRLQKDPSPRVRATALHLEHDACQIEQIEAGLDQAEEQGWRYSDPDWVSAKKQRQATRYWLPLTSDPAIPITTDLTLATRGETAKVERERRSG